MVKSLSIIAMVALPRSTLTSYIDHMLLVEGKRSTTIPFVGLQTRE